MTNRRVFLRNSATFLRHVLSPLPDRKREVLRFFSRHLADQPAALPEYMFGRRCIDLAKILVVDAVGPDEETLGA